MESFLLHLSPITMQFACFAGVGAVATACHYAVMISLVRLFGISAVTASAVGFLFSVFVNYGLNYRFTFKSDKNHADASLKFILVAAVGLSFNTLIMWSLLQITSLHYLVVQVIATILVLIWNFSANRLWTFRASACRQEDIQG